MGDGLAAALDRAADVAEQSAREQRQVAAQARRAALRERAAPGDPGTAEHVRLVLDGFGASAERLAAAVGELRRAWVRTLADGGNSVRRIAEQLGVSHQRISVLLAHHRDPVHGAVGNEGVLERPVR